MTWVAVAVAGAAVVGAVASDNASSKAAKASKNANRNATQLQREQFNQGLNEVRPFKEAGLSALPGLQAAANDPVTPFAYRDQNQYLNDYFSSNEYNILNKKANDQILRTSSATGGIRNGNTNASLMDVAPTLGLDALNRANQQDSNVYSINQGALTDRFNRLNSVASMGANVATGNQNQGANFASNAGNNAIAAGQASAARSQQQGQIAVGLTSDLASAYIGNRMGYYNNPSQASGVSQSGYTGTAYQNWVSQQQGKV